MAIGAVAGPRSSTSRLPNFALNRLSRYEATLWRQMGRVLFALMRWIRTNPKSERAAYMVASQQKPRALRSRDVASFLTLNFLAFGQPL